MFLLISLPAFEISLMIKSVIYLGMLTGNFLGLCITFKSLDRSVKSSKWQVRMFSTAACPATA